MNIIYRVSITGVKKADKLVLINKETTPRKAGNKPYST